MDRALLIAANQKRWDNATYNEHAKAIALQVARRLCAEKAKAVYLTLEHMTGVPWYAIAMIHEREASQSWAANIAQGDPWNRRSVHVPKGRGPFNSFVEAAVDALTKCPPHASQWKDWSPGGLLTLLEDYNGEGYENYHHMASPYLWAGSNQYTRGKYVSDGHFDPSAVDSQLGCSVLLHAMLEVDPSITIGAVEPVPVVDENGPPTVDDEVYAKPDQPSQPVPIANTLNQPPASVGGVPNWLTDSAKQKAQDAISNVPVKSLFKSRIGWGTVGLAGSTTATAVANVPVSALDHVVNGLKSPVFWLVVVNIALATFVLYHYWKDHGKGSL